MTLETTDTAGYEQKPIPDGEHTFKIIHVERVDKVPGMYEWELSAEDGEDYEVSLFGNEMGDLLRLLGCNETSKNKFQWDTVSVEGRSFKATAFQLADKKKPEVMRQKLNEFKADAKDTGIPF